MKMKMITAVTVAFAAQAAVADIAPAKVDAAVKKVVAAIDAQKMHVGLCVVSEVKVDGTKLTIKGTTGNQRNFKIEDDFAGDPRDNQISDTTAAPFETIKVVHVPYSHVLGNYGDYLAQTWPKTTFVFDASAGGALVDMGSICKDSKFDNAYNQALAKTEELKKEAAAAAQKAGQAVQNGEDAAKKVYHDHFPGANQQ